MRPFTSAVPEQITSIGFEEALAGKRRVGASEVRVLEDAHEARLALQQKQQTVSPVRRVRTRLTLEPVM
jgi:hypothetical protein